MLTDRIINAEDGKMARFSVDIKLANRIDVGLAERGLIDPDKVQQITIKGLVDTGATDLVIPADVAKKLNATDAGEVRVRYADGRRAKRKIVRDVQVELLGRTDTFHAIVEPKRDSAIIGAFVLEGLDLIVDCKNQTLIPRDPDYILVEIG